MTDQFILTGKVTDGQSTDLPELAVPQKEGYIASVEKVPSASNNSYR